MRNFIISSESACDLTQNQLKELDIHTLPMNFYVDGVEYSSKTTTLSTIDICNKMKSGSKTSTSQPNEAEIEEYLSSLLKENKDILHLSFSSAMSGTYASFKKVAEKLNQQNENKIYVVDSLCQSGGLGLLLTLVCDKCESNNLSITEAVEYAEKTKLNINHFFIVEDLKYLARGGRISPTLATIGNLIKLKPVLYLNNEGKITQLQKVLGRKKSISTLIDKFVKNFSNESKKIIICQANCETDAENLKTQLLAINPTLEIAINPLGPVITSHAGPGTMALFVTTNGR